MERTNIFSKSYSNSQIHNSKKEINMCNTRPFDFSTYVKELQHELNKYKQDFDAKTSHAKQDF